MRERLTGVVGLLANDLVEHRLAFAVFLLLTAEFLHAVDTLLVDAALTVWQQTTSFCHSFPDSSRVYYHCNYVTL